MNKYTLIDEYLNKGITWNEMLSMGVTDSDRKKYYGYKEAVEQHGDELLSQEKQRVRQLKKELSIERQINNEQLKYLVEAKMINDQRKETKITSVDIWFENEDIDIPTRGIEYKSWFIYVLSDFHYNGDKDTLKVLNTVRSEIIGHIQQNKLDDIVIVELGDVVEGATLRPSQLMAIKSGIIQQTLEVANAYKLMLESIIEETNVNMTLISVTSSNHTQLRNLGTKRNELPDEDMMLVFNSVIKETKGLDTFIEGDEIITDINGYNFYFAHGHTVKHKEGHIQKVGSRLGKLIDFGFLGHYHHMRSIDLFKSNKYNRLYDIKVFYNPALATHETQYEKDLNVSSCAGFGIYEFNNKNGNISTRKVVVDE